MFRTSMLRSLQRRHAAASPSISFMTQRRFHALGVSPELVEKLASMGLTTPTPAQSKAIPSILHGSDVVIAAETGGGKTLSYLVPVLEHLKRHPLAMEDIHRPVALILTTSQELVGQIMAVLRAVDSDSARYASALSSTNQLLPQRVCPLLVATPKALLRATKPRDFAFTRHIIVDEADMLLGGGFERDTKQIIATIRNQPLKKAELNQWTLQNDATVNRYSDEARELLAEEISSDSRQTVFSAFVVAYATIPDYGKRSVREFIDHKFPDAKFAVTEDFHRTLPRLDITVHHLEETDSDLPRMELLVKILTDSTASEAVEGNTLVFAKSIESAGALHQYLTNTQKMDALLYHKEISRDERQQVLKTLQDSTANSVVVCTDIAARGLDTTTVRHVVQYEFANDVVSYIHRIGRTARAGTKGKVSSIASEQNELVLSKIEDAGHGSLDRAFSRKRSLRKKVKKARRDARDSDY